MNRRNFISNIVTVAALMPVIVKIPDSVHWEFIKSTDGSYLGTRVFYGGKLIGKITEEFKCFRIYKGDCRILKSGKPFWAAECYWQPNPAESNLIFHGEKPYWLPAQVRQYSNYSQCIDWFQEKYTL